MWIEILKKEVAAKGPKVVAQELGIDRTTVDLAVANKYGASTRRIEERVRNIYGKNGIVSCSILGEISPSQCAEKWNLAKRIGMKAGNPDTLKLYKACMRCSVRVVK